MKKIIITFLTCMLLVTHSAEAQTKSRPLTPDLKNKQVIAQMKNGTYPVNGVKLGTTYQEACGLWKKPWALHTSYLKRYDLIMQYEKSETMVTAYFNGRKNLDKQQYKMTDISYMYPDIYFPREQMKKKWGKYDFKYPNAGSVNYIYGHTVLSYTKYDEWTLTSIWYADNAKIKEEKKKFKE